jgi:hypothetical protein
VDIAIVPENVMKAGSGGLKPETASSAAASNAETPPPPSVPLAPDVNRVIQAAVEGVIAANGAADAAMSLANKAAHSTVAASNAVAHGGSRPAGEAMSTANRAAEHHAYDANKASDAAAIIADKAGSKPGRPNSPLRCCNTLTNNWRLFLLCRLRNV